MKQFLSVLALMAFMTSASFASFPVKDKKDTKEETTVVATEQVEAEAVMVDEKASKLERKVAKIKNKISKKMEGMGAGDTTAIILALVSVLLLPFGLHNWYLGRKKQALWQTLLVFPFGFLLVTALISWIWQIVDLIRLLGDGLP